MPKCRAKKKPCKSNKCPDRQANVARVPSSPKSQNTPVGNSSDNKPKQTQAKTPLAKKATVANAPGAAAEERGYIYVAENMPDGWSVEKTGKSSKLSDLKIFDENKTPMGFIEVKQIPTAASGQIVVSKQGDEWVANDIKNPHTLNVMKMINKYQLGNDVDGVPIAPNGQVIDVNDKENKVLWGWMKHHWETKEVIGLYLTNKAKDYEIFVELDEIQNKVNLLLTHPRAKKSGTSHLPVGLRKSFTVGLTNRSPAGFKQSRTDGKSLIVTVDFTINTNDPLDNRAYYLSLLDTGEYAVKQKAKTNNPTVHIKIAPKIRLTDEDGVDLTAALVTLKGIKPGDK